MAIGHGVKKHMVHQPNLMYDLDDRSRCLLDNDFKNIYWRNVLINWLLTCKTLHDAYDTNNLSFQIVTNVYKHTIQSYFHLIHVWIFTLSKGFDFLLCEQKLSLSQPLSLLTSHGTTFSSAYGAESRLFSTWNAALSELTFLGISESSMIKLVTSKGKK